MCGIAGVVGSDLNDQRLSRFAAAGRVQQHRGPDHQAIRRYDGVGQTASTRDTVFLHQRLSIIDLSAAANQPFEDETHALIFNGEIYNYVELRARLQREGVAFATDSDTEVLFRALIHWGVAKTLSNCNGMWTFAWLDKRRREVVLARDRFGVKPLYVQRTSGAVYFASEIKTVLELSQQKVTVSRETVGLFLRQAALETSPAKTFFNEIEKLPPGTYVTVSLDAHVANNKLDIVPYYELKVQDELAALSLDDACREIRTRVQNAVEIRLRADVPVGVLLSGGLDSSILASAALRLHQKPVVLLSYVSDDPRFDESPHSTAMGQHLGQDPHRVKIAFKSDSRSVMHDLEKLAWQNDQPLHSFAAYAHYLLMAKAKELGVVVLLSGQGADEGFCGYRKYWPLYLQRLVQTGHFFRASRAMFQLLRAPDLYAGLKFSEIARYLPGARSPSATAGSGFLISPTTPIVMRLKAGESIEARQIRDFKETSVPSLLHYEDRMSMAHAREIRLPFLDYRVVELGVSLPMQYKLSNGWTKYALRKAFSADLPESIAWRRDKKGFSNPQSEWIRSTLKSEIESRFSGDAHIYRLGLIDRGVLLDAYSKVLAGDRWADDLAVFRALSTELFLQAYSGSIVGVQ